MYKIVLITLCLFLLSCSSDSTDTGDGIQIKIEVAKELIDDILIVSSEGKKPGTVNPIDTFITLKNNGDNERQVLLKGSWLDANGGLYGGISSVVTFPPGHIETFQNGTRSQNVSIYKLAVSLTEQSQDELLTERLADTSVQISEGYGMTYTEQPSLNIPLWSPRGVANTEPFQAKTITFRADTPKFFPRWVLAISDRQFDVSKGAGIARYTHKDLQTIKINLPREPVAGDIFKQDMSYGGGYFQIKTSASANSTTSWNTSIAYIIEITRWDAEPSTQGGCTYPSVGTASGRLYISFKGSENSIKNSWVSGTFENAAIIHCKKPE